MKIPLVLAVLMLVSSPAMARKDCNELKSEIEAKIKARGVKSFTLEIVAGEAKDGTIVGSCDGGAKKIIYKKG
jgi:hypothetical protein